MFGLSSGHLSCFHLFTVRSSAAVKILVQALVEACFHFSWLYYTQEWNYKVIFGAPLLAQTIKESASNAGDPGLIPGSGRSLGEGNGNPL